MLPIAKVLYPRTGSKWGKQGENKMKNMTVYIVLDFLSNSETNTGTKVL